jgi:hypothetical protein
MYSRTECQLTFLPAPILDENSAARSASLAAIQTAVREAGAHVGVWISERGDQCEFVDDAGGIVASLELLVHLAAWQLAEHPGRCVVIGPTEIGPTLFGPTLFEPTGIGPTGIEPTKRGELLKPVFDAVTQLGGRPVRGGGTREQQFAAMVEHHAVVGGGTTGRFWVHDSSPIDDATVALAGILQRLSRGDTPLSKLRQ